MVAKPKTLTKEKRKLVVDVPVELHRALKIYAVQADRTIREVVIEAIETTIGDKSRTKGKKK